MLFVFVVLISIIIIIINYKELLLYKLMARKH